MMFRPASRTVASIVTLLGLLSACGRDAPPERSPRGAQARSARPDITEALRRDLSSPRHPSDGGGRVWFEGTPESAVSGQPGRWTFVFETGPAGIAEGGKLFFQAPPFWGWSTPQVMSSEAVGFTTVEITSSDVELRAQTIDLQLLAIEVRGRALAQGEQVRLSYGAGPLGALADRYAESRSCFYFAVDGDGDGIRSLVGDRLCIEVTAGPASRLLLTLPSTARPRDRVSLRAALVDPVGNRAANWTGNVALTGPQGVPLPESISIGPEDGGVGEVEIEVLGPAVIRLQGATEDGLTAESNPLVVDGAATRILWADLHGHSGLSDGTGTPQDYFRYARDVGALDIVALTDHDHWGMEPLTLHPELWEEIRRETDLYHQPDRFVTLLGYEWTNWIHGHRHVLFFSDQGEIFSSVDERFESPRQLWEALRGRQALTLAHHSAGGPVATDWSVAPDPDLEPLTEIVSVHGSSEAPDTPGRIYSPIAGNFVRDALAKGYELGFVGSGDGHDGHPGLAHLSAASGGLAAVLSDSLTRAGVWQAMRSRRVYATNGPRIVLHTDVAERAMGSTLETDWLDTLEPSQLVLEARVTAPQSLDRLEVVRTGQVVEAATCGEQRECRLEHRLEDLRAGEYLYLRAIQVDGGAAWSSPYFIR